MADDSLHGFDDVHKAAAGIFDSLPDDPFGEEEPKDADQEPAEEADVDAEAVDALGGDDEEVEEADDEGVEEEAEAEEDDEEVVEEPEGDEDEAPVYTVKVDGEEIEVTLEELQQGFSRTSSYTRKSQKLAEERRAFQSEMQAVREERGRYAAMLSTLEQKLQAQEPQAPTSNDPHQWVAYQRAVQERQAVEAERIALQQKMQADHEAQRQAHIEAEHARLLEIYPDWKDPEVVTAEMSGIAKYALGLGFSEDDVDSIQDHKVVMLLKKAMEHDKLAEARTKAKKKAKGKPVLKPGKSRPRSPAGKKKAKAVQSKRNRLKESGREQDAADFFFDMIE